jgi:threonine dehydrogenase-like Zn-dependent dehydrogenase
VTAGVRAAVMQAPRTLTVETFPYPDVKPGAVLMRVLYSGICGTDKHTYRGETKQYAGTPHEREITYPLICGHENVGVVAATGGPVADSEGVVLRPGDRIVPAANVPCGACSACRNGYPYYLCDHLEDYGNSLHCGPAPHLFGGWAEHMYLLPGTPIFRVPDQLPSELAALTEPMSVTHGLDTARALLAGTGGARFSESAIIVGLGPLGLCHLIKARLTGFGRIVVSDCLPSRLHVAELLGATLTLNAVTTSVAERLEAVQAHFGGRGPDIAVDCSGVPETFVESLRLVRPGGVVVEAGAFVDLGSVGINPNADICTRSVSVVGVGGETTAAYLPSMHLLAQNMDRLPLRSVITHRFPLEHAAEAVELAQTDSAMKVLMAPNGDQAEAKVPT